MTNEEIKKEFNRWIDAGRPAVWYKSNVDNQWRLVYKGENPSWITDFTYIVDDKYAELRILEIDAPDTKFQIKRSKEGIWKDCDIPSWYKGVEYRVKPKSKVERRWRYAKDEDGYTITASSYVSDRYAKGARHLECGWYKLENDYIDVEVEA